MTPSSTETGPQKSKYPFLAVRSALLLDLLHNQVGEVALLAIVGGEEELQCGLFVKSNG